MSFASTAAFVPPKRIIRPHTKVRTGCKTCKRRHIKCDEYKPICNNCVQRKIPCVWQETKGNTRSKRRRRQLNVKGVEEVRDKALVSSPQLLKQPTSHLDVITLELVHHYTVHGSSALCSNVDFTFTCRTAIPKLSFTNLFLWHAMLSSTALHLGHLYPSDNPKRTEWLSLASFHRKISLNLHHTITLTAAEPPPPTSITDSDTKYIGIGFLTLYTISSALSISPSNIFSLLTTMHNMWSKINSFTFTDPTLGAMMPMHPISHSPVPVSGPILLYLKRIYVPNDNSIPDSSELRDPEITDAYKSAVDALLYTFYPLTQTGFEVMGAIQWPAFFSKRFCDLLNEKRQRALVLLYHYLVILRRIGDEGYWWACDMGRCEEYVYGLVNEEWRMWLERRWIDGGLMEGAVIHRR
ncbi:hypothetical protein VNI00_010301 [Paramarasmius palmivorus]|uniref:Zn(2)-C6 fungal-type domain-containing protein n=1 Tax=Paramarasmius palmivorus TaxID=297713 RepID=A0AAW0CKN3_9AGAR